MTVVVEAEPSSPELFDGVVVDARQTPGEELAESLTAAYLTRVGAYHRDLKREFAIGGRAESDDGAGLAVSAYPSMVRSSDVTELLVFDADLFATVLDIWTFEGWPAIARIEADLAKKVRPEGKPDQPSAGTPPSAPLFVAYGFFLYCRNMLAVFVTRALVDVERQVATRMVARLSVTANKLATVWSKELRITRKVTKGNVAYTVGNTALLATLMKALADAVGQRVAFEKLLDKITNLKALLLQVNARIARKGKHALRNPKPALADRERYTATLKEQTALRDASAGYYSAMKGVIGTNCPLALLVVDGLAPGFDQPALESALGAALWEVYAHLDELAKAIEPAKGRADTILIQLSAVDAASVTPTLVQRLTVPAEGPEEKVANGAIAALGSDAGMLPLLHTTTWQLLQQHELDSGSFEYVVVHRYLETLADSLERIAEHDANVAAFAERFNRGNAALSIALLVTPLAEFAPLLKTVSVAGDLAMAAYLISSVTGNLRRLSDQLSTTLLEPDAYATENLARLGELMVARADFASTLTQQLLLELLGLIAGGAWKTVRKLMVARSFVLDMQTVFAPDDAAAHG